MTPVFVLLLLEMWSDWRLSGTAGRGESHGRRQPSRSGWTRLQPSGGGEEEFSTPVSNLAFYSLIPRPRPAFHHLYCWKQWKAGRGLGTRLRFLLVQKQSAWERPSNETTLFCNSSLASKCYQTSTVLLSGNFSGVFWSSTTVCGAVVLWAHAADCVPNCTPSCEGKRQWGQLHVARTVNILNVSLIARGLRTRLIHNGPP